MAPFYEALGVQVKAVLTDNGREFFGRAESHPPSPPKQRRHLQRKTGQHFRIPQAIRILEKRRDGKRLDRPL